MTKRERQLLRQAIHELHDGQDYFKGMALLCKLAGIEWPGGEAVLATTETRSLRDILREMEETK